MTNKEAMEVFCLAAEQLSSEAERLVGKASGGALALMLAAKYLEYKARSQQGDAEFAEYLATRDMLLGDAERFNRHCIAAEKAGVS